MRSEISFRFGRGTAGVAVAGALVLGFPSAAPSQEIIEVVDGQPITVLDIEHRAKFLQMSSKKVPSRKEVMDSLLDEILQITEAGRQGIQISDQEVEKSYEDTARRMGIDGSKLTQVLTAGGASEDTLKRRLRAQIAWAKLMGAKYNGPERREMK